MNGKILYVEDDAYKASESFLTGLLSDLIVPELKRNIGQLSSSVNNVKRSRSQFAEKTIYSGNPNSIRAEELKRIVDKDPRIVYHYDFLAALKYICSEYSNIELCVLDRNLQCTMKESDIRNEMESLGVEFSKNDYDFIAPLNNDGETRNQNNQREGNFLLEKLHEKAGDDILEKIYILSGYECDLKQDRHHAYILRKFNEDHYIGKKETAKINFYKTRFKEIQSFKNYDIIAKSFPHIFDVIDDPRLRFFLDKVISHYNKGNSEEFELNDFMSSFRQIIEKINDYLTDDNRRNLKPYFKVKDPSRIRNLFTTVANQNRSAIEDLKEKGQDYQCNVTIPNDFLNEFLNGDPCKSAIACLIDQKDEYLRHPTSALDAAYTMCCDYIHVQSGNKKLKEQSDFMKINLENDFICRYIYDSVKLFFTWLKFYR